MYYSIRCNVRVVRSEHRIKYDYCIIIHFILQLNDSAISALFQLQVFLPFKTVPIVELYTYSQEKTYAHRDRKSDDKLQVYEYYNFIILTQQYYYYYYHYRYRRISCRTASNI